MYREAYTGGTTHHGREAYTHQGASQRGIYPPGCLSGCVKGSFLASQGVKQGGFRTVLPQKQGETGGLGPFYLRSRENGRVLGPFYLRNRENEEVFRTVLPQKQEKGEVLGPFYLRNRRKGEN